MGRHNRKIIFAAAALLCAALAFACVRHTGRKNSPLRIVMIQKALDDTDFWTSIAQGGEMAAEEHDAVLTVAGPPREQEIGMQNEMILDAIADRPDAIVLAPGSSEEDTSLCPADRRGRHSPGSSGFHNGRKSGGFRRRYR